MSVHLCLSVMLTVISLIVFICTVTYELIGLNDDDDASFGAHCTNLNEDRPIHAATKM